MRSAGFVGIAVERAGGVEGGAVALIGARYSYPTWMEDKRSCLERF